MLPTFGAAMQAFHWPKVDTAVNWIDYYLNPADLEDLVKGNSGRAESNSVQLLLEFCEQAEKLDKKLKKFKGADDERWFMERRFHKLKAMAMFVCSSMDWNLKLLLDSIGLYYCQFVLRALVEVMAKKDLSMLDVFKAGASSAPTGLSVFPIVLYARWVLTALLHERLRVDEVPETTPQSAMHRNSQRMAKQRDFLPKLESMETLAVKFLQEFLSISPVDVVHFPVSQCFRFVSKDEDKVIYDWDVCTRLDADSFRAMIQYDLTEYLFERMQYGAAKRMVSALLPRVDEVKSKLGGHCHWMKADVQGYAWALGIPLPSCEQQDMPAYLEDLPADEISRIIMESTDMTLTERVVVEQSNRELVKPLLDSVRIANSVHGFCRSQPFTGRVLKLFSNPDIAAVFCATARSLTTGSHGTSLKTLSIYIQHLCAFEPQFREALIKCDEANVFANLLDEHVAMSVDLAASSDTSMVTSDVMRGCGMDWQFLRTWKAEQFRSDILRGAFKMPPSERVRSNAMMDFREKMAPGEESDVLRVCLFKMDRLLALNIYKTTPKWADVCMAELSDPLRSRIGFDMACETLRRELTVWHRTFGSGAKTDRLNAWTEVLTPKVRSYVVECRGQQDINPTSELNLLVTCFLLNIADWNFILCSSPPGFGGKYMDFSKMLAALSFELSNDGSNVRVYAREFFDIVTTALAMGLQVKRGTSSSGAQAVAGRDAEAPFLNRVQFIDMLKLIKEKYSISILLSFFCKLFNNSKRSVVEIAAERMEVWPSAPLTSTFDPVFLEEALVVIFHNAFAVDPTRPFWLRTYADYNLIIENYDEAMVRYLELLVINSNCFSRLITPNTVDKRMANNIILCLRKMGLHVLETVFCQFCDPPNYLLACKTCLQPSSEGAEYFYSMIWDPTMLEVLIASFADKDYKPKKNALLKFMGCPEMNSSNDKVFAEEMVRRRQSEFLRAVCNFMWSTDVKYN